MSIMAGQEPVEGHEASQLKRLLADAEEAVK
jgi:hypothetical protein